MNDRSCQDRRYGSSRGPSGQGKENFFLEVGPVSSSSQQALQERCLYFLIRTGSLRSVLSLMSEPSQSSSVSSKVSLDRQQAYRSPDPSLCPITAMRPPGSTRASAMESQRSRSLSLAVDSLAFSGEATSSKRTRSARCPMNSESNPYARTVGSLLSRPDWVCCSTMNSSARHSAPLSVGLKRPQSTARHPSAFMANPLRTSSGSGWMGTGRSRVSLIRRLYIFARFKEIDPQRIRMPRLRMMHHTATSWNRVDLPAPGATFTTRCSLSSDSRY